MDLHLEGFAASFVDVWGLYYSKSTALSRKWHWARNARAGTDSRLDNLASRLVNHAMIVGLEADTNGETFLFLICHFDLSRPITSKNGVVRTG